METVIGAISSVDTIVEGAVALGKGILHPTLPIRVNLRRITSPSIPRTAHSLSVVKGRAYIFGGESSGGEIVNNDMHIIILPSSGVSDTDYTVVSARGIEAGKVPSARKHHTASVVGDRIHIYGGECADGAKDGNGTIWVFDTTTNTWSILQPEDGSDTPTPRAHHAAAASELPETRDDDANLKATTRILPQAPPDPAKHLTEPPDPGSYGSLFIYGGVAVGGEDGVTEEKLLDDTWAFDIRSRRWTRVSEGTSTGRKDASLVLVDDKLYRSGGFNGSSRCDAIVDWLSVSSIVKKLSSSASDKPGMRKLSLAQMSEDWSTITPNVKDSTLPSARDGAGLVQVTAGQGRDYLLLIGGNAERKASPDSDQNVDETLKNENKPLLSATGEIWSYQIPSAATSAAVAKDATRKLIHMNTREAAWAEAQYKYLNAIQEEIKPLEAGIEEGQGIGPRSNFAAARGTEVDGCTAMVWGGVRSESEDGTNVSVYSDGWLITVER